MMARVFEPYAYQQYCIDKIVREPSVGLFLSMGLGKSVITLSAIRILRYESFRIRKALVIAPKKVAEGTWMQERDKWEHLSILRISPVLGSTSRRIKALNTLSDVYVINRENVTWLVEHYKQAWPFDMVVVDESTSFKSHSAKRFKSLAAIRPHVSHWVILTGTPAPNSLEDLWAQVFLLDGGERLEKRFTAFRQRYFDPGRRGADGMVYTYKAKPGTQDSILEKISDICVSMRAEDYLELPDLIVDDVPVILEPKAEKAYNDLERKMILELPEDEELISVTSAAALSNKLLQITNGAIYDEDHMWHEVHGSKIDAFLELIESLRASGDRALVFYSFRHDLERLLAGLRRMKLLVRVLEGADDITAWNGGGVDVLLAHPASAAYGLNLQEGGNHIVWFGLTWSFEQFTQANARLHRQGQEKPVFVHRLVCRGTRDEDVLAALSAKADVQTFVLESLKARIRKVRGTE